MKFKNEVILAGLLHDIGKFYMRSGRQSGEIDGVNLVGKHQDISVSFINRYKNMFSKFVDIEATREMVQRHHEGLYVLDSPHLDVKYAPEEYKAYCKIVALADNISSSERDKDGTDEESMFNSEGKKLTYANAALHSVFSRADDIRYGYKFGEWSYDNIQPISEHDENNTVDNLNHIENFSIYMTKLSSVTFDNFENMYEALYKLLNKFIWCCPSAFQSVIRDISLFDHLSTTSAIAISIYNEVYDKYGEDFDEKKVKKASENIVSFHIKLNGIETLLEDIKSSGHTVLTEAARVQSLVNNFMDRLVKIVTKDSCIANCAIKYGTEVFIIASESEFKGIDKKLVELNSELLDKSGSRVSIAYAKSKLTKNSGLVCVTDKLNENLLIRTLYNGGKWNTAKFVDINSSINLEEQKGVIVAKSNEYSYAKVFKLKADNVIKILEDKFTNIEDGRDYHSISRISTYMRMVNFAFEDNIKRITEGKAISISLGVGENIIVCNPMTMINVAFNAYLGAAKVSSKNLILYGSVIKVMNKSRTSDILGKLNKAEAETMAILKGGGVNYIDNITDWNNLRAVNSMKKSILKEVESGALSKNVVNKFKQFSSSYKKYIETKDASYLMLFSSYNNLSNKHIMSVNSKISSEFKQLLNEIFEACVTKENVKLKLLELAVDESIDSLRKGE